MEKTLHCRYFDEKNKYIGRYFDRKNTKDILLNIRTKESRYIFDRKEQNNAHLLLEKTLT